MLNWRRKVLNWIRLTTNYTIYIKLAHVNSLLHLMLYESYALSKSTWLCQIIYLQKTMIRYKCTVYNSVYLRLTASARAIYSLIVAILCYNVKPQKSLFFNILLGKLLSNMMINDSRSYSCYRCGHWVESYIFLIKISLLS